MDDLRGKGTERRQLTVLFCDIVDSTGLSERCDPEDLSEILLQFQTVSTRCIKDVGGNVVNYIGDGIRSEFGYPLASENEAESAVRAGLALLRAVEQLSERSIATIQEPLRVRIGVHTGLAVIGKAAVGQHCISLAGTRQPQLAGDQRRDKTPAARKISAAAARGPHAQGAIAEDAGLSGPG